MEQNINIDKTFEKLILVNTKLNHKEFESCTFINCDFSNSNFSNNSFTDCEFINCNLSMVSLAATSLKTVTFKNCKLLGIQFQSCTDFLFNVNFHDSIVDYASFTNKKMTKTVFNNCSMKEVNFTQTNLTDSIFDHCNLDNAIFNNTILNTTNFATAYNYNIDPEFNLSCGHKYFCINLPYYDIKKFPSVG